MTNPKELKDLRSFSILPEGVGVVETSKVASSTNCGFAPKAQTSSFYKDVTLQRPQSNCCVAILRIQNDGKVILNPEGYVYGPIPPLIKMSEKQADELWKTEGRKRVTEKIVSYDLVRCGDPQKTVQIDIIFRKNGVQKYRIVSIGLASPNWNEVKFRKRKEGSAIAPLLQKTIDG